MNKKHHPAEMPSDSSGGRFSNFMGPFAVSFVAHMIFFALMFFSPTPTMERPNISSVIRVNMVTLPEKASAPAVKPPARIKKEPPKKTVVKKKTSPVVKTTKKAPPVIKRKKKKISLKKKTFKSTKVVKSAIKELEKHIEETKPDPIETALERLKKKVGEEQFRENIKKKAATSKTSGTGKGKSRYSEGGKKIADLIDIYRIEIAFQIQKNWAFSSQLAGESNNLQASVVFKVMPNGEIQDLFFTDRSGNQYLDDSAYKAVMKSNPVDPHPEGINRAYVHVGLRFTPEGVR